MSMHERQQIKAIKEMIKSYNSCIKTWNMTDNSQFDKAYTAGCQDVINNLKVLLED